MPSPTPPRTPTPPENCFKCIGFELQHRDHLPFKVQHRYRCCVHTYPPTLHFQEALDSLGADQTVNIIVTEKLLKSTTVYPRCQGIQAYIQSMHKC